MKTLESAPKLDPERGDGDGAHVDERERRRARDPGRRRGTRSANDWFVGETFQFIKYDATAGHTDPIGPLTNDDGKTASLTPASLINQ